MNEWSSESAESSPINKEANNEFNIIHLMSDPEGNS